MKYDVRFIIWCTTTEFRIDVFVVPNKGDSVIINYKTYKVVDKTIDYDNNDIIVYIKEYGN